MPWKCPACQLVIQHSDDESVPRAGAQYRCHVCRLELTLDPETNQLTVMPALSDSGDNQPPDRSTR